MTTIPAAPASFPQPRPQHAPAPAGPTPLGAIDPIKLLNKHKWLLVGAAVLGGLLGTGAHYALVFTYPRYTPRVIFACLPPSASVADSGERFVNDIEMTRFMQTEARAMVSERVMTQVVEDPQLRAEVKDWKKGYEVTDKATGQTRFDTVEAAKDLREDVGARVIPQTTFIELSITAGNKFDATAILKLIKEKYLQTLVDKNRLSQEERSAALRQSLERIDKDLLAYASRRQTIIKERNVESIDNRLDATTSQLQDVNEKLNEVDQSLQAGRTSLEAMERELNAAGGVTFGDDLRDEIEKDSLVVSLKNDIGRLETQQQAMLLQGISREHREYKRLGAMIEGSRTNIEQTKNELLRKKFDGRLDSTRKTIAQLEAQRSGLITEQTRLAARLEDLTGAQRLIKDLDDQIEGQIEVKTKLSGALQEFIGVSSLGTAGRVQVFQSERVPTELAFPKLKVMVPAGIVLTLGLVGGLVFLREIVDQRVKGPSDVTLIPRTRLVGWLPDAAEDPAGQGAAETAFRDRPKGIVAEGFRQVRGTLAKRLAAADHKTLLVMAGMPSSGATSVAANLALAFAAADRRVLIVDANFRRPALHRVFGLQEFPGLADVLSKTRDLEGAIQATTTPNLDLLSAGSREQRVFERLAAEGMGEVLATLRTRYDLVILDVAPAIVAGDGLALAQRCDASLLVVKAYSEKRGMVARVKNELTDARAEFLGVVVNAVRSSTGGYMKGNIKAAHEYSQA